MNLKISLLLGTGLVNYFLSRKKVLTFLSPSCRMTLSTIFTNHQSLAWKWTIFNRGVLDQVKMNLPFTLSLY